MQNLVNYPFLLLLSCLLALTACEQDEVLKTEEESTILIGDFFPAEVSVFGQLVDNQDNPIANALVTAGDKTTRTDEQGLWSIDDATVGLRRGYITFEADNYLFGSRTVFASEGSRYQIDVQLLPSTPTASIDAATGGSAQVEGTQASVTFGPAAFAKTDGTPIASGQVNVVAHYLDASEDDTYRQMPGDLRGIEVGSQELTLMTSFGMMAVELTDDAGNTVELAAGQTATLTMPLAEAALANAPSTIPLWYFDDAAGYWIQEGEATLLDGAYVGEVSHFTFWNCDIPMDNVQLCGRILFEQSGAATDDSAATSSIYLTLESSTFGTAYGYLDDDGKFCGVVPANERLILRAFGYNECRSELYRTEIGPFSDATDLGDIEVVAEDPRVIEISGTAVCNGDAVTNGAVIVSQGGTRLASAPVNADGSWSLDAISCTDADINVSVLDYATQRSSTELTFALAATIDAGAVSACEEELTNYYEVIIDGESFLGDDNIWIFSDDGSYSGYSVKVDTSEGEFGYEVLLSGLPSPLTVGTYTVNTTDNSRNSLFLISPDFRGFGLEVESPALNISITKVPDADNPYIAGTLGPVEQVGFDANGNEETYTVQINFSALTEQ